MAEDGETRTCQALSYQISGESAAQFLQATPLEGCKSVTVTFYLFEDVLHKVQVLCDRGENSISLDFWLGQDPLTQTLAVDYVQSNNGSFCETRITVDTQRTEDSYQETWTISGTGEKDAVYRFAYCPYTGEMTIDTGLAEEAAKLILLEEESGFTIVSQDFSKLMRMLPDGQMLDIPQNISGSIAVTRGSAINTPEYKNLDQWSLEDFWSLLTGIGSLFGISLP